MVQEEIDETSQICFNKKKSQICHRWDENTMSVVLSLSLKSSGFFLSKKKKKQSSGFDYQKEKVKWIRAFIVVDQWAFRF